MLRNVQSEAMGPCAFIRPIPACWDHLTLGSAALRLPTLGYTFVFPLISCAFAAVTPARETDHGLPGLAVKNETDASSLGEVCFF